MGEWFWGEQTLIINTNSLLELGKVAIFQQLSWILLFVLTPEAS
jgi:hypothetical protein